MGDRATRRQTRTAWLDHARSSVRYAALLAFPMPPLTFAVVLPPVLRSKVPAVALATSFEQGLSPAIAGAVTLTPKARFAHAKHPAAPLTPASEELDQLCAARHRHEARGRRALKVGDLGRSPRPEPLPYTPRFTPRPFLRPGRSSTARRGRSPHAPHTPQAWSMSVPHPSRGSYNGVPERVQPAPATIRAEPSGSGSSPGSWPPRWSRWIWAAPRVRCSACGAWRGCRSLRRAAYTLGIR